MVQHASYKINCSVQHLAFPDPFRQNKGLLNITIAQYNIQTYTLIVSDILLSV